MHNLGKKIPKPWDIRGPYGDQGQDGPSPHPPPPPNPTQDVTLTWLCGLGGVGSLSYDSHLSAILLSSSVPVCTVPTSSVPASSVPASPVPVCTVSASTVSGLHSADLLSLAGLFSVGLFGGSSQVLGLHTVPASTVPAMVLKMQATEAPQGSFNNTSQQYRLP